MQLNEYYRRKRQANALKRLVFYVFFLLLSAAALWGSFWAPYFRISKLEFDGINSSEVGNAISSYIHSKNKFFLPQNHYLFLSADRIKEIFREKDFGTASVQKLFPNKLVVKFEKSEPWLIWCPPRLALGEAGSPDCYYIDEKGALSDRAPYFSELPLPQVRIKDPIIAKLGNSIISSEDTVFLKAWLLSLKTIDALPSEIEFLGKAEIKIFLKEGWFIYLSRNSDPQKLFTDLRLLLEQKIKDSRPKLEYIDLRFENKAFYKLR